MSLTVAHPSGSQSCYFDRQLGHGMLRLRGRPTSSQNSWYSFRDVHSASKVASLASPADVIAGHAIKAVSINEATAASFETMLKIRKRLRRSHDCADGGTTGRGSVGEGGQDKREPLLLGDSLPSPKSCSDAI